jgi:hypothetical protein
MKATPTRYQRRFALAGLLALAFLAGADRGQGCGPLNVGDSRGTPDAGACRDGQTSCSGKCVDLTSDSSNCGTCGTACQPSQFCQRGTCAIADAGCTTGSPCNGTCVDFTADPANCGSCGTACPSGQECVRSQCIVQDAGCDASSLCFGVCVDLNNDPQNCGSCNYVCAYGLRCYTGQCI